MDNFTGIVFYSIFEGSNNTQRFKTFMEGLLEKLNGGRAFIVLDNLPIHKAHVVTGLVENTHSTIVNTPPYSCQLNSIEWLSHVVKDR